MKKIIAILILFISAKCFSQVENNFMQKNTFWDSVYFKVVPYSASAGIVHLGIDTVVSSPTFGKLVRKTAGGATPDLQAVTDIDNQTTNHIGAENFRSWPIFSGARYTSNFVSALGYAGNGVTAIGNIVLRELSDGSGNTVTLSPLDMADDIELFLPEGNTGDTLATKSYVRSAIAAVLSPSPISFAVYKEKDILGILIKAIKDQQSQIDRLNTEIEKLKTKRRRQ